ncbi:transcriptional regulator, partial [Mesorhizobium sp. M4B.F.Ca.ET.088.02.2.1]
MHNIDDKTAIELTADIVSAYVGNNPLPASGLPDLIASVSASVRKLSSVAAAKEAPVLNPAVNPKRSVFPDHIVCLEDGKKFKSLKRHLATDHGLTPDEY